ncbi:MAG TPA: phosphotransferase, partial [Acidimicrobiales bacterium]
IDGFAGLNNHRGKTRTVSHGDYRLDNMLFGTADGGYPLAVVDWQTVSWGEATADASYFLGAGLLPADRAAHERDLLRVYHEGLGAYGIDGYSWDECWADYRRHAFGGYVMAVVASQLVHDTDRGREMFAVMAERHAAQALDLESETFFGPS